MGTWGHRTTGAPPLWAHGGLGHPGTPPPQIQRLGAWGPLSMLGWDTWGQQWGLEHPHLWAQHLRSLPGGAGGAALQPGAPLPPPPPHVTQCPLMSPTQRSQAGEEEEEEGDSTPQPRRPHGWHLAGRWDKDLGDTGTPPHLGDPPALVNPPPQHDRDPSPLYWEAEPPRPPPDLCGSPIPQKSPTAPSPPPWVPQPNPTSTPH